MMDLLRKYPRRFYWGVVLCIAVAGNIVIGISRIRQVKADPQPSQPFTTQAIYKRTVSDRFRAAVTRSVGKGWKVALLGVIEQPLPNAVFDYAEEISSLYKDRGLRVCMALADPSLLPGDRRRSLGVLPDRMDISAESGLPLQSGRNALLLLDSDGVVQFFMHGVPSVDDLRQLVQKSLGDTIQYDVSSHPIASLFIPGQDVPNMTIVRPAGNSQAQPLPTLFPEGGLLIVMTARCSDCQFETYLSRIRSVKQRLTTKSPPEDVALLFSEPSTAPPSSVDVANDLFPGNVFTVAAASPVYDPLQTRFTTDALGPVLVEISTSRHVVSVSPLATEKER